MSARRTRLAIVLVAACAAGCDAPSEVDAATRVAAAPTVANDAPSVSATPRLFDRAMFRGEEDCLLLDVPDVAEVTGVPGADIAINPAIDCYFEWAGGRVYADVDVHDNAERAREYFQGLTGNYSDAEMQAAIDAVTDELGARADAGEVSRDQAAGGGALAGAIPEVDMDSAPLAGLGDAASEGGNRIVVLTGNAILDIGAERNDTFDLALSRKVAERVLRNMREL